jgi:hypothetical protein
MPLDQQQLLEGKAALLEVVAVLPVGVTAVPVAAAPSGAQAQ